MTSALVAAALLAGVAGATIGPPRARSPRPTPAGPAPGIHRYRVPLAGLAAMAGLTLVDRPWGWPVGALLFAGVWIAAGRVEPASVRRQREQTRRDLPHVVQLLSLALSAGASVRGALRLVEEAVPESTGVLHGARVRLELGVDPDTVWTDVAALPDLAPLGRALVRAGLVGASPSVALARLADDLVDEARTEVEERARSVGIKAALPLGLCLLPAFLLIGITPLVVSALGALRWS